MAGGQHLISHFEDSETTRLRNEVEGLSNSLNNLIKTARFAGSDERSGLAELTIENFTALKNAHGAALERLNRSDLIHGRNPLAITAQRVAMKLQPREAYLGFRVDPGWKLIEPAPQAPARLVSCVIVSGGKPEWTDLGPVSATEAAVNEWRDSLKQVDGESEGSRERRVHQAGVELRQLVFDPIKGLNDKLERLWVCLDGPLHLVPLDSLPDRSGTSILAKRLEIRHLVGLNVWLNPSESSVTELGIVLAGGLDCGSSKSTDLDPSRTFKALPHSALEVEMVLEVFRLHGEGGTKALREKEASRNRLRTAAERTRILHLATHGYFDPSLSNEDGELPECWEDFGSQNMLARLQPFALCGLAVSGANAPPDAAGTTQLITADELSTWNLKACQLAVLSACETAIGTHRTGLGVQSMQAALHIAGAHEAVTSLWQMRDQATTSFMAQFYTFLLRDKLTVADALRRTKLKLRRERYPTEHWAGWVVSGAAR